MLITPLTVKNAASSRPRSPGRMSECSYASSAATVTTPSQYRRPTSRPRPATASSATAPDVEDASGREDAALAEPGRPRVQALLAVVLEVEERVEEVEAGDPERDGPAERPRLPGEVTGHGDPRSHRRQPERGSEPEMAGPGDALQIGVDDEEDDRDRPEPAHDRVELEDGDEEDRERARHRAPAPAGARASRPGARGLPSADCGRRSRRRSAGSGPSPACGRRPSPPSPRASPPPKAPRRARAASRRTRTGARRRCARA